MPFKALIIDYGGVLTLNGTWGLMVRKYCQDHNLDEEKILQEMKTIWNQAKVAEIPSEHFWDKLESLTGIQRETIRKDTIEFVGINMKMLNFIKEQKTRYQLILLSNQIEDWLETIIDRYHFRDIFDLIVTSYETKLAKPDPKIFEYVLDQTGLQSCDCLLIDDQEKNINMATKLGIKSIRFQNFDQFREEFDEITRS